MTLRVVAACAAIGMAIPVAAQVTGPSFNAPYRAFARYELGATMAFPRGGGTQIEGQYRFGYRTFDVGVRAGVHFVGNAGGETLLAGVVARNRVVTHTESFPMDGAIIFGAGVASNNGTVWNFPIGLSLGRRLNLEGSDVSIVPYVQPTGFITTGGGNSDFVIGVGFGADFRLSAVFDARISVGIGDGPEGLAISAVWVR